MKAASLKELKQELDLVSPAKLLDLCVRLAKYKKENKELLSYLLFEAHDETAFLTGIKNEMEIQFAGVNRSNLYFAKKSFRKILRFTNKYIKYTGSKQAEVELLLTYCKLLLNSGIALQKNTALMNLYHGQVKKISKLIATLHEDLQYDYFKELNHLSKV